MTLCEVNLKDGEILREWKVLCIEPAEQPDEICVFLPPGNPNGTFEDWETLVHCGNLAIILFGE